MKRIRQPTTFELKFGVLGLHTTREWWMLRGQPLICCAGLKEFFGISPESTGKVKMEVSPARNGGKLIHLERGEGTKTYWSIVGKTEPSPYMSTCLWSYIVGNLQTNESQELYVKFSPLTQPRTS